MIIRQGRIYAKLPHLSSMVTGIYTQAVDEVANDCFTQLD